MHFKSHHALYSYIVYEEDRTAFEETMNSILNMLEDGQDPDRELLYKFLSFISAFADTGKPNKQFDKTAYSKLTASAISYFSKEDIKKHYDFNGESIQTVYKFDKENRYTTIPEKNIIQYSLNTLLEYCIDAFLSWYSPDNKKAALTTFMNLVNEYVSSIMNDNDSKHLTQYKRMVIAGYLTHIASGYKLIDPSKEISFTNQDLYNAARNALKKGS